MKLLEKDSRKILNPDTNRKISIDTALTYDKDSKVYKIAKKIIDKQNSSDDNNDEKKNSRSHKPKAESKKINPVFTQKFGHLKLSKYPSVDVDEASVKINDKGDLSTHAVLSWRDPKTNTIVKAYTPEFKAKNDLIKWARIKKIKEKDINNIKKSSNKLLKNKNVKISDAGAIIKIIAETGLRPGSKGGFNYSGNRGTSTLKADNIIIDGDNIKFNFLGKSYQENLAETTDKELANYLKKKIASKGDSEFLFDSTEHYIDKMFHAITDHKDMKIKDLRTYAATKLAKNILETDTKFPPPPMPETPKEIKKAIKAKLKDVFERVSERLNNTPAMAKSSYVHPQVITDWLKSIGVKPKLIESSFKLSTIVSEIMKTVIKEDQKKYTDADIKKMESEMNQEDLEDCDEYNLPDWWDNDKIELVPIDKK